MFHTENARLLSESAVFALWMYASPVVCGFQDRHRKANLVLGVMPALCTRYAATPPDHVVRHSFS